MTSTSDNEDRIPADVPKPIDRISEQSPIIKEQISLLESYNDEIPGSLDVTEDGRLYTKILTFTNLTSDLTDIYDKYMFKNALELITRKSEINLAPYSIIRFVQLESHTNPNLTPLVCRQLGKTYSMENFVTAVKYIPVNGNWVPETLKNGETITYKFSIGEIPIMLGSSGCVTRINKMTPEERFAIGECAEDPPGYFIIDGAEYTIPLQDKVSTNRAIVTINKDPDNNKEFYGVKMTCDNMILSTSTVNIIRDLDMVYKVKVSSLSAENYKMVNINILQIFQLFGYKRDDAIKLVCSYTKPEWRQSLRTELLTTVNHKKNILDDIDFFTKESGKYADIQNKRDREARFKMDLERELFANFVITNPYDTRALAYVDNQKMHTMAFMLCRLLEVVVGHRKVDSRDSWALKRVASPGMKVYQLFLSKWNEFQRNVITSYALRKNKSSSDSLESILRDAKDSIDLKNVYESSFKTNWGTNKFNKETKQTDILNRQSKLSPWAAMRKIVTPGSKENKSMQPREPQMGQYGYISGADTPEGKDQLGLTKNLGVTVLISIGRDDGIIIEQLRIQNLMAGDDPTKRILFDINDKNGVPFILNGKIMFRCLGKETSDFLIDKRRKGIVPKDTSIIYVEADRVLYVFTDNGRLTRPLFVINQETNNLVIDEKNMWDSPIEDLISNGCIEYIDTFEHEYTYIALNIEAARNRLQEIKDFEAGIEQLNNDIMFFRQGGTFENKQILEELARNKKKITDTREKLSTLKNRLAMHQQNLKNIEETVIDNNLSEIEKKLKKIDYDYYHKREKKMEKNITKQIETQEKILEDLLPLGEVSITEDYLKAKLDIAEEKLKRLRSLKPYTHCEVHSSSIMSISESVIPLANRNPSTRVGFQCGMGRQAMGIFHSNEKYRFDTTAKMLVSPQAPILYGQNSNIVGLNKYGHGENVIFALAIYGGYNQEDATIMKRAFVERGGLRSRVNKKISGTVKKINKPNPYEYVKEALTKNPPLSKDKSLGLYRHLGPNGIAKPESVVHQGDCLIGISRTVTTRDSTKSVDASVYVESEYEGYVVDRYDVVESNTEITVNISLRDFRFPSVGDKFASRISQKVTIGKIMDEIDMPFTDDGLVPDIISSPMSVTSRSTGSYLLELLIGKVALMQNRRINVGSLDKNIRTEDFMEVLAEHGYDRRGVVSMTSGLTGKRFKALIFVGPSYLQALKHQVKDKIQARQRGTRDQLTYQPIKGRKRGGGIKFGEMERDNFIAHGAAYELRAVTYVSSDAFTDIICKKCSNPFAIMFKVSERKFMCQLCQSSENIVKIELPYATISFASLVHLAGINLKPLIGQSGSF